MAEVQDDIPATAQKTDNKGCTVRSNSTGKFNSQPTKRKVLPHYLQAPTGSCHDLCKSGSVPHVVEAKERTHFAERHAKTVDKTQYQGRNFTNSNPRKKKTVLKIQAPYKCEVIMEEEVLRSTKKETCASDLKLKPVKTKVISLTEPSRLSIHYTEFILPKDFGVVQASSNDKRIGESKTVKETKTSSKTPKGSMKKSSTMTTLPSLSAPKQLSRKLSEIVIPKVEKNPGTISSSEIEIIKKKGDFLSRKTSISEVSGKEFAKSNEPQKGFPLNEVNSADLAETKEPVIPEKIFFILDPKAENDSLTCHSSPYVDRNDLTATSSNIEKIMDCNNDITDATQLLIERRDKINADCKAESPQSTLCSPDCSDKIDHIEQEQNPRRIRRVLSEKNLSSLQKVKFARGKEVDPPFDDSSPRKAKFREGNVLEYQNGKAENRGRRLRRLVSDVTDKVKTSSVKKVDLRHQEVIRRMTSAPSFNNVIEETASKLAESRKSKVKALVGAFETVISLQDQKEPNETTSAG